MYTHKNESAKNEQAEISALVRNIQAGEKDALQPLVERFSSLIEKTVRSFQNSTVLKNVEHDELRQECRITLYNAALNFDLSQDKVTFGLYAKISLRNRMISKEREYRRETRGRSDKAVDEGRIPAPASTRRAFEDLNINLDSLSRREREAFKLRLAGTSYEDAAAMLHCSVKSFDNALFRAKNKLKKQHAKKAAPSGE